jgi:hypothetical protein
MWRSRSHARHFLNKIREELPTSCECDLLKMERVDWRSGGGELILIFFLQFSTWRVLFN